MIFDANDFFKLTNGSDILAATGTTAVLSDFKFPLKDRADMPQAFGVKFMCLGGSPAAGASFTLEILHTDVATVPVAGDYAVAASIVVPRAEAVAGAQYPTLRLPMKLKNKVAVRVVPAASMTGTTNFQAVFTDQ